MEMGSTLRRSLSWSPRVLSVALSLASCTHSQPSNTKPRPLQSDESFVGRPVRLTPALREGLDELARRAAAQLQVPGAALAVVHGGKVVLEQCWGERTIGGEPVTEDTLFMIGSITKPMTTMMQAALADQGRVRWTTPLSALLPQLSASSSEHVRKLLLWHASCACSGMPGADMENLSSFGREKRRFASCASTRPDIA